MANPINGSVLRLLDANANRAREALRVLEDYARFVLDDGELSAGLKGIRHEFAAVLRTLLGEAIVHRDTPGDVGVGNKTESELHRADISEVVTAAGKRLGEALRAIEEYIKTISPAEAGRIERLRYSFYDLEQRVARTLCRAKCFVDVRLYVLITEKCCRRPWLEAAEQALLGGADCLQLREKELEGREVLHRAKQLVELCRRHGRLCIINDRVDIAILSDADGVHVGQEDLPAAEVRKLVGNDKIIGVSTHRIEQAKRALLDGADYVGVGPMYRSSTKPRDIVAGLEYARQVAKDVPIPAVAIAGITPANVDEVVATGVQAVAVTAAVLDTDDPRKAAEELKRRLLSASGKTLVGQVAFPPVGQTFLSVPSPGVRGVLTPPSGLGVEAAPQEPAVEKGRRRLPHWRLTGSTYFLTFRVAEGELNIAERRVVMDHVRSGDPKFYTLIAAIIMPDHVHLLVTPMEGVELSRITKGIKGISARLLNQRRGTVGAVWQDESWDRIVRDQDELDEKLEYMLNNPVKKDLVEDPWTYDGWYYNEKWKEQMGKGK